MTAATVTAAEPGTLPTLDLIALLAGAGGLRLEPPDPGPLRSCIDAGAAAVVTVRAPGPRALEAFVRRGGAGGVQRWEGVRAAADAPAERWVRLTYGAGAEPLADDPCGALAGSGRLWSLEAEPGGTPLRTCWHVDRHRGVRWALERIGRADAWPAAAEALDALHGFGVSASAGPWSVGLPYGGGPVRIGTTRWAWSVEDDAKRDRLARWIDRHGGDGAYASALVTLLAPAAPDAAPVRVVGRAAEVDVTGGRVVGVAAHLAVHLDPHPHPERSRP